MRERESQSEDLLGENNNMLEGRDIMNSQTEREHNELQITLNLDSAPHHCIGVAVPICSVLTYFLKRKI